MSIKDLIEAIWKVISELKNSIHDWLVWLYNYKWTVPEKVITYFVCALFILLGVCTVMLIVKICRGEKLTGQDKNMKFQNRGHRS
jgi:uncharacterized protein involved in cysteine biosynthesis